MVIKTLRELSLRPYSGRLFITKTRQDYQLAHQQLFKVSDVLKCNQNGRFSGGCGRDGIWTYLIWGIQKHDIVHELSHVVLHVFERCGIDPREAGGEPFCYLLSHLFLEIKS